MSATTNNARCAECGTPLLAGPAGPQCPRCAFALAAGWKPRPLAEPTDERALGDRFPEYRFIEKIGQGGFGAVYRVEHRRLKRPAAVKLLPESLTRAVGVVSRFEREMAAVGRLDHPGIVRAFDAGERDGQWFITMEFIEGADLGAISRAVGPLPPAEASELIRQAALALDYAHRRGLVHRDVKPGNLMLARGETAATVKVLDFGLAVVTEAGGGELTHSGEFLGTVEYIAPELLRAHTATDARADVYGLGATLYRLLTGVAPHEAALPGESLLQKLMRIAAEKPTPMAERRADLPPGLAALVDRLLARDPAARPASAAEVAELLAPYCPGADLGALLERAGDRRQLETPPPGETPPIFKPGRRRRRQRQMWLALAAFVMLASIVGARWYFAQTPAGPVATEGPLTFFEHGWRLAQTIDTTPHVRFARFHPLTGDVWFGDGVSGIHQMDRRGDTMRVHDRNLYNGVFLPGENPTLLGTIHNPPQVGRNTTEDTAEPLEIPFAPGEHPWGLAVVPPGWTGGRGLAPGDALLGVGSETGADHLWVLHGSEPPHLLSLTNELPPGLFDATTTRDAAYFASWAGKASRPEDDAIWRLDATTFAPIDIEPPLTELVPGPRGPVSLACDPGTGDLVIAIPPSVKVPGGSHANLFHLHRQDSAGRRFKAKLLAEGFADLARFGLAFSPDGHRLAVTDDGAGKIFLLEHR